MYVTCLALTWMSILLLPLCRWQKDINFTSLPLQAIAQVEITASMSIGSLSAVLPSHIDAPTFLLKYAIACPKQRFLFARMAKGHFVLPKGWVLNRDKNNRLYFAKHGTKTTILSRFARRVKDTTWCSARTLVSFQGSC